MLFTRIPSLILLAAVLSANAVLSNPLPAGTGDTHQTTLHAGHAGDSHASAAPTVEEKKFLEKANVFGLPKLEELLVLLGIKHETVDDLITMLQKEGGKGHHGLPMSPHGPHGLGVKTEPKKE